MEHLILLLNRVYRLSPALEAHLRKKIQHFTFKKGQPLVIAGEVADKILYLEKGLIRSYSLINGVKASNYFMREGDLIISVESFFQQIPAYDSIEAEEDCICWGISYDELQETYIKYPKFNIHGRILTALYYCKSEARHRSQHRKTPEEMYKNLIENDGDLLSRVRDSHVASYLDVSKATYSKIKRHYSESQGSWRRKSV